MKVLTDKMREGWKRMSYLPRTLALVWRASARWTAAWVAVLLAQGLTPIATVYLTKELVDSVVEALGRRQGFQSVAIWVGLMALVMLLAGILGSLASLIRTGQSALLSDYISGMIHEQSARVDYAFYEMSDYYDRLHRAREDASYRPMMLVESMGGLLQDGVTLVGMAAVLMGFGWWLPAALLLSTLPALLIVVRHTVRQHEWRKRHTQDERRAWYYDWMQTTDYGAAEIRLFDLGAHFRTAYQSLRGELRAGQLRLARRQSVEELLASLVALLVMGAAMVWIVGRAVEGAVSLGALALFYQAFNQGQGLMRSLLGNAGQLYANSLFLGDLFEFLALEPGLGDPAVPISAPVPLKEGIEFRQVRFRYPNSERVVFEDFSLRVPAGKITAIVGLNGAGKTTLIKLLCRLYDPERGEVTLDGVDLRRLRIADLRRMITVLFQQPVRYNTTAGENIRLGDITAAADGGRLVTAAKSAGAAEVIEKLPDKYESLLGKWFVEGNELSVGEWQRIALARAFWREAQILLLDEPTSAMDSWAETDWMSRFRELAAGRTVLMITHRFTTAMRADMIHVMVEGRIVESGNHQALLSIDGIYAQSWKAQMQVTTEAANAGGQSDA